MNNIIPEDRLPSATLSLHGKDARAQSKAPAASEQVLTISCPLCCAPSSSCGLTGSHLARWLRAFAMCRISREDLIVAVHALVVVSASQIVERAA